LLLHPILLVVSQLKQRTRTIKNSASVEAKLSSNVKEPTEEVQAASVVYILLNDVHV
jgi:hypothetical protein